MAEYVAYPGLSVSRARADGREYVAEYVAYSHTCVETSRERAGLSGARTKGAKGGSMWRSMKRNMLYSDYVPHTVSMYEFHIMTVIIDLIVLQCGV